MTATIDIADSLSHSLCACIRVDRRLQAPLFGITLFAFELQKKYIGQRMAEAEEAKRKQAAAPLR